MGGKQELDDMEQVLGGMGLGDMERGWDGRVLVQEVGGMELAQVGGMGLVLGDKELVRSVGLLHT